MLLILALAVAVLVGCASVGYYGQAIRGHLDLTFKRRSIDGLLESPNTPEDLRGRLERVQDIRRYAVTELGLPDSGSYSHYADLGRDVTVWLLTAAPEFSLRPREWCYPFVGCLNYRGFFSREDAEKEAAKLEAQGYETALAPGLAYSTLGFMNDPILNTMLVYGDAQLAGVIFHELAHERVFIRGDTRFNESFASAVEKLGRRQYVQDRNLPVNPLDEVVRAERQEEFTAMLRDARRRLRDLYASELPPEAMRERKQQTLIELQQDFLLFKSRWDGYTGFDHWFEPALPNNADLALIATYESAVPAFERLFRESGENFPAFYAAVERLSRLSPDERERRLEDLGAEVAAP